MQVKNMQLKCMLGKFWVCMVSPALSLGCWGAHVTRAPMHAIRARKYQQRKYQQRVFPFKKLCVKGNCMYVTMFMANPKAAKNSILNSCNFSKWQLIISHYTNPFNLIHVGLKTTQTIVFGTLKQHFLH